MRMGLFICVIVAIIAVSGCATTDSGVATAPTNAILAKELCVNLCGNARDSQDLGNGPCLSDNNPEWTISGWVCDVAHMPREDIDNLVENQCRDFNFGSASHFVEVDTECNFIRSV